MTACWEKDCKYRIWNMGDEISDFYYCKLVGTEVGRGLDECLEDRFDKEIAEEELE